MREDFRRETVQFIESNKISINKIVRILGVHPNTARNWKKGKTSPSKPQFEQLKKIGIDTMEKVDLEVLVFKVQENTQEIGKLRERVAILETKAGK